MDILFLGQGYESLSENSVGKKLIQFLRDSDFHSFTAISAFTSQAAVKGFSKYIEAAKLLFKKIVIVTGIDQQGTSKEALEELLNLGIDAFIFYQPSITIFHPKIYLFEGTERSEMIVGSSNLTSQGLFTNVEASILISINNNITADQKTVDQLKTYFKGIFEFSDPNLKRITKEIIDDLVNAGFVPTEAERKKAQDKTGNFDEKINIDRILKIFPKRSIAQIPSDFRKRADQSTTKKVSKIEPIIIQGQPLKLLWTSGPLTERDLNIPKGSNTNPTGSMLFKKGKTKDIDQRHYFRDKVFAGLLWASETNLKTAHLEKTTALFKIIIGDIDYGDFRLTISHNSKTDTSTYRQKNSVTSISWGSAKKIIAKEELIGKSMELYGNNVEGEFTIQIK